VHLKAARARDATEGPAALWCAPRHFVKKVLPSPFCIALYKCAQEFRIEPFHLSAHIVEVLHYLINFYTSKTKPPTMNAVKRVFGGGSGDADKAEGVLQTSCIINHTSWSSSA
jgi:hypothetical protein